MDDAVRCALLARADEPLPGTAPVAAHWLLVQDHGPWGRDALADGALPRAVRAHLAAETARHDVRYQAIRRPDRRRRPTRSVFLVNLAAGWTARLDLLVEDLVDLDVAAATAEEPPVGSVVVTDPIVAVCTHGRRDACCAQWGRPLVTALAAVGGDAVWETSHTGGHRFAPSVLSFPSGAVHGFVNEVGGFWAAVGAGRLDLATYRGNAALARPAQAAEVAVRRDRHLDATTDIVGVDVDGTGDRVTARVHHRGPDGRPAITLVDLARRDLPDGPVSCGADPVPRATWDVVS